MPSVYAACCGVRTFGDDKEDCARTRSHAYHCHRQPRVAMPPLSARPPPAFGRECECERVCACVVMAMWRSAVYVCVCSMYTRVYTMQRTAPQSTTNSDTNTFKRTRNANLHFAQDSLSLSHSPLCESSLPVSLCLVHSLASPISLSLGLV